MASSRVSVAGHPREIKNKGSRSTAWAGGATRAGQGMCRGYGRQKAKTKKDRRLNVRTGAQKKTGRASRTRRFSGHLVRCKRNPKNKIPPAVLTRCKFFSCNRRAHAHDRDDRRRRQTSVFREPVARRPTGWTRHTPDPRHVCGRRSSAVVGRRRRRRRRRCGRLNDAPRSLSPAAAAAADGPKRYRARPSSGCGRGNHRHREESDDRFGRVPAAAAAVSRARGKGERGSAHVFPHGRGRWPETFWFMRSPPNLFHRRRGINGGEPP